MKKIKMAHQPQPQPQPRIRKLPLLAFVFFFCCCCCLPSAVAFVTPNQTRGVLLARDNLQLLGNGGLVNAGRLSLSLPASSPEDGVAERVIEAGPLRRSKVVLPSGQELEVLIQAPSPRSDLRDSPLPPVLFLHGSFHAAWCWAEHWMPFLAAKGYETYAISLRGTSGSPIFNPEDDQRRKQAKVCIGEHVQDITQYMDIIMDSGKLPPVLVSHSMAGLYLLKVLEKVSGEVEFGRGTPVHSLSGAMLFCSVPPAGIGPMTLRMVRSRPIAAIKTILGVAMKLATSWPWLARDIFFGESMGQENILRYMKYFTADSQTSLDLRDLTDNLPGRQVGESGTALWVGAPAAPPVQVAGADGDYFVDAPAIAETARFCGVDPIMLPGSAHDVMLGPDWPLGAARLLAFLEGLPRRK